VYTVPLGKKLTISGVFFSCAYSTAGKSERMTLHTSVSPSGVVLTSGTLFYPQFEAMLVDGNVDAHVMIVCPEKTDLKVSIIGETNAQSTSKIVGWLE
jgi:hypothetical protein